MDFPHKSVDQEQAAATKAVGGGQRLRLERVSIRDHQHQRALLPTARATVAVGESTAACRTTFVTSSLMIRQAVPTTSSDMPQ
ncbi:hypothetical protein [Streptomyces antibioticus]|uniref:hypothetical protein n=1 Tax=Streptomyces antibioticus TaxID=1890 RepID=UPI0033BCE939